jgi:hypothetical protein
MGGVSPYLNFHMLSKRSCMALLPAEGSSGRACTSYVALSHPPVHNTYCRRSSRPTPTFFRLQVSHSLFLGCISLGPASCYSSRDRMWPWLRPAGSSFWSILSLIPFDPGSIVYGCETRCKPEARALSTRICAILTTLVNTANAARLGGHSIRVAVSVGIMRSGRSRISKRVAKPVLYRNSR